MREVMDRAFRDYTSSGSVEAYSDKTLFISPVIHRDCGPAVTVTLLDGKGVTYGNIVAAGLIRLKSNHRVLAWRGQLLADYGKLGRDIFTAKFVEGTDQGQHKDVPPFVIGDLAQTDQALRYLLSCWAVTGRRAEYSAAPVTELMDEYLLPFGQRLFPSPMHDLQVRGCWPTDKTLAKALTQGPKYVTGVRAA